MEAEAVIEKKNSSPDNAHKKDKKKREDKPDKQIKHKRPEEYERNADLITPETELPPLPKKNEILPKPNIDQYKQKQAKNRQKISKLIAQKKQIRNQKFKAGKKINKGEGSAHDEFNAEVAQFQQLKQRFTEAKVERNLKRDEFRKLIEEAKKNTAELKELRQATKNSKESIEERLQKLEHKLITDDLSKNQQKDLNNEIMQLKRTVKDAESVGNVQVRIARCQQRKSELDQQIQRVKADKQPLEQQCKQLQDQMDKKNEAINKIKGDIKVENQTKTDIKQKNDKQYEEWKQGKKKRLDSAQTKIQQIDKQTKSFWEQYNEKMDKYWQQKHKVDFLQWQHRIKKRKVQAIEREKRRQAAIQREKQREKEQQLKKYIKQIQLCNFLINYLKDLSNPQKQQQKNQDKQETQVDQKQVAAKITQDSQWKKQKGLQVLHSKKSKEDQQPVKKGKKNKKKKEQNKQQKAPKFQIPLSVQVMFDSLKVLAPESPEQIQKKIDELKDREALFQRACSEDVNQQDKETIDKIKSGNKTQKPAKKENKKVQQGEEFPSL